jgi:hypothetical protein
MLWQDLLLDRWTDGQTLVQALATVFEVSPTAVRIVDDLTVPELELAATTVLAERTRRYGQFPLQLSVYIRDRAIWQRTHGFGETLRLTQRFCALVHAACLIAGDAEHADDDFVVRPSGEILRVTLDEDRLARDEFVVVASESFTPAAVSPSA